MCRMILLIVCLAFHPNVQAQTFSEWFKQKQTQKKYLLKQIAELQLYLGYVKKGYSIAQNGLNVIERVRKGEFSLHDVFYDGLSLVSPYLKKYPPSLVAAQNIIKIHQQCSQLRKQAGSAFLDPPAVSTIRSLSDRMLQDCAILLDDLVATLTDKRLQLSDDQRIERIDRIRESSDQMVVLSQNASQQVAVYNMQRIGEELELKRIYKFYKK